MHQQKYLLAEKDTKLKHPQVKLAKIFDSLSHPGVHIQLTGNFASPSLSLYRSLDFRPGAKVLKLQTQRALVYLLSMYLLVSSVSEFVVAFLIYTNVQSLALFDLKVFWLSFTYHVRLWPSVVALS